MQQLNFKKYAFRFKNNENKPLIFDPVRKKFMVLTPEEWVRQHVLNFLLDEKNYPISHINVEKQLELNGTKKRYDIVVFNNNGSIQLIVECKRPEVTITQTTFDQIARYNMALNASYLMVTNGVHHYYCRIEKEKERYIFLEELPTYQNT